MVDVIQNIITNRLTFLSYIELQSHVSAEQSEQKSILQWTGKNIKLKTLLPGESMIHNASISIVLENDIKKIGYQTIKNKPGQVNLNITFS